VYLSVFQLAETMVTSSCVLWWVG